MQSMGLSKAAPMQRVQTRKAKLPSTRLFLPLLLLLSVLLSFFVASLEKSAGKPFWLDEAFSFQRNISDQSMKQIILQGADGQGSPSPLYYVILRNILLIQGEVNYFGLQPHQYYRVPNAIFIYLAMLYLFFMIRKHDGVQGLMPLVLSATAFVSSSTILHFSSEMRPYSLWVALSMIVLFLIEYRNRSRIAWSIALLALALSSTGSLFQITSLLGVLLLAEIVYQKKVIPKIKMDHILIVILVTFVINAYYIARAPDLAYETPPWVEFFDFWKWQVRILIVGLLLSAYHLKQDDTDAFIGSLTVATWIAIGPLIFYIIQKQGFFFSSRHYIYYLAASSYLGYQILRLIPRWVSSIDLKDPNRKIVLSLLQIGGFVFVLFLVGGRSAPRDLGIAFKSLVPNRSVVIPARYEIIKTRIPDRIPGSYEFITVDDREEANWIARLNFDTWWVYLSSVYPSDKYPRDASTILQVRAYDGETCGVSCRSFEVVNLLQTP